MKTDINKKLFALHKLKGVGPATLRKLMSIPGFDSASVADLADQNTKLKKSFEAPGAWEHAMQQAELDAEAARAVGARIISVLDADYPRLLLGTSDCPFFLYVQGSWAVDTAKTVAVIGTRQPTAHGAAIAGRIAGYLATEGWSIISGLAMGCDALAHHAALEAGGHTVAVLAHGLHTIAPRQNEGLARKILDGGGALVTEYAFGEDPIPPNFVKRDRIQAGLARGVVMVQSDLTGGSLHASRAALEYGRLLAVPVPTERDRSIGDKKIEANLVCAGDCDPDKLRLLHCQVGDLKRLMLLNGRDDYKKLEERLLCNS
jgi:DNA processing protein